MLEFKQLQFCAAVCRRYSANREQSYRMYSIRSQTSFNPSASWITSAYSVKQIEWVWVLGPLTFTGFFLSATFKSFRPAELVYLLSDSHPKGAVVKKGAPGHNGKRDINFWTAEVSFLAVGKWVTKASGHAFVVFRLNRDIWTVRSRRFSSPQDLGSQISQVFITASTD